MNNIYNSGEIVKRYVCRGKFVVIVKIDNDSSAYYSFKIEDRRGKKDYFSNPYETFEQCEKDSFKVAKGIV